MATGVSPTDADLGEALQAALRGAGRRRAREFRRRPSEYRTSFPLEELDVDLEDGAERAARLQAAGVAAGSTSRRGWPSRASSTTRAARPPSTRSVLEPAALGASSLLRLGASTPRRDRYWLFVEWVEGRELYQVGERELWEAAARWLAGCTPSSAAELERPRRARSSARPRRDLLPALDAAGARVRPGDGAAAVRRQRARPARRAYGPSIEALLALPKTVIHGEFYASNVLVATNPRTARRPGRLGARRHRARPDRSRRARQRRVDGGAIGRRSPPPTPPPPTRRSARLDFARLQLAVQWLGWAPPAWMPPEGQRHDWLAEALALAERLGL